MRDATARGAGCGASGAGMACVFNALQRVVATNKWLKGERGSEIMYGTVPGVEDLLEAVTSGKADFALLVRGAIFRVPWWMANARRDADDHALLGPSPSHAVDAPFHHSAPQRQLHGIGSQEHPEGRCAKGVADMHASDSWPASERD